MANFCSDSPIVPSPILMVEDSSDCPKPCSDTLLRLELAAFAVDSSISMPKPSRLIIAQ
jgi:hypothetical protein